MEGLRIAFVPIARSTFDMDLASQVTEAARAHLQAAGFKLVGPAQLVTDLPTARSVGRELAGDPIDLLIAFQATFADSTMVTSIAEAINSPLFLWAVPETPAGGRLRLNSLCGVNLAAHALTLRAQNYAYAYAQPTDRSILTQLRSLASAGNVYRRLRGARLGLVGEHPPGMDTCHLDETALKEGLGIDILHIDLGVVFERAQGIQEPLLEATRAKLDQRLDNLAELDQNPLRGTLSVYLALKQIAEEGELDGLAVRCWPEFFTQLGCAACGAMSMLSDGLGMTSPIPCSCEADINGTITQLILGWLADEPAFGSDLVAADYDENNVVLWHCGLAPLSMANPNFQPRGGIHSNRGVPLVMEFSLKPGPVTIARLSQATGELRLVVGSGEMLNAPQSFIGTSGILRFNRPARAILDTILGEGLEHHVSITYGDHMNALLALAKMLELPTLSL